MRLITISGPHGAGKGTTQDELLPLFSDRVRRITPVTTRKPRDGEQHGREYYFIEPDEFRRLQAEGELVFEVPIRNHHSGTTRSELFREDKAGFIDIVPHGARQLRDLVVNAGGQALTILLIACRQERFHRIRRRQPDLTGEQIWRMLDNDPVPADPALYRDFDLCVENGDGQFQRTLSIVKLHVEEFLNGNDKGH
ncbi:MAG: hypothetical protein HY545_02755 [Candidatus Doudnabacteria bacterium]|nr:hypothetical protein [Candidatus Doudnabacteria bacterium]